MCTYWLASIDFKIRITKSKQKIQDLLDSMVQSYTDIFEESSGVSVRFDIAFAGFLVISVKGRFGVVRREQLHRLNRRKDNCLK